MFDYFRKATFNSISINEEVINLLSPYISQKKDFFMLDLGCGAGSFILEICKKHKHISGKGIDISKENIEMSKNNAKNLNLINALEFIHNDYLSFRGEKFDLIFSESTLHLIPAKDEILFKKISNDLKNNGKIIIISPYKCVYNYLLISFRKILKFFRTKMLDSIILKISKKVYPNYSLEDLKDRVEYMYIVPKRLFSKNKKKLHSKIYLKDVITLPKSYERSIFKPKHLMLIFEKIE